MFIVLLSSIINASSHTKCMSSTNPKCKIQPTLISLNPSEYSQELDNSVHLQLNYIDVLEIVILLMTYIIKYVFQIKQNI